MKKITLLICLIICLGFFVSTPAKAEIGHTQDTGWFLGVGGLVGGYEVNELRAIGGGLTWQAGYKLNEYLALYVQSDAYYTNDSGINFLASNFMPTLKVNVYETLYFYAGGGYAGMYAWGGVTAAGLTITGSSWYHGFCGDGGLGYEYYITDNWTVAPQVGVNYTYIASGHLITPNVRVNFNYHF